MSPRHAVGDGSIPRRRVVICAGVGKHFFDPHCSLRYADDDCRKIVEAICYRQRFGFNLDDARILGCSAPRAADRPLRSVLLANLWDELAEEKIDLLVLYLAMHGVEHNGRTYLVPEDGVPRHRETLISLGDLLTMMSRVDARQRLVIYDGCHGGGVGARRLPASFASEICDMPELTVLSACDIGEASYDCQELQGGVYTHYLAEALREEQIDADNRLPLSRVHERAERLTKEWAAEHGVVQSPRDFANRRTTINLFPPSGDVLPLPRQTTNKKDRTVNIVEALRHILEHHRDRISLGHFCIRIYARLSSFAVADDENWQHLDQEYFELVRDERDLLMELLDAGARVKLVLSWDATDLMEFQQVDLEKRLRQLYKFFDDMRMDDRRTARFSVVRTPIHDRNLLALDNFYVFIGRKLGLAGGLDVTQIIQDPAGVSDEIGFFDAVFDEAFRNLCEEENLSSSKPDNAELLRLALLEIKAGLRLLETRPLPAKPGHP